MITPLEQYAELGQAIGAKDLWFKREDLHPYGSHKGRSISHMIDHYELAGERKFAISSSGNAALAAALHVKKLNKSKGKDGSTDLDIFIGLHIDPKKADKLKALADEHIRVLSKERPLQALNEATKAGDRSLRQSVDDIALVGYGSLADELGAYEGLGAIFIGTSSGTTAQALAQYFAKNNLPVQIHIVQTSTCHPMAEVFENYDGPPEEHSLAGAIVDKIVMRKPALIPLIEYSGGRGWIATNEDIQAAYELTLKYTGLTLSPNSALSVVGVMKAVAAGHKLRGAVVCMICGD